MAIDIESVIERALEPAFARALERVVQSKVEVIFQKVFAEGSPLSQKVEEKIRAGLDRFFDEGIRWQTKKAGFKK